MPVINVHRNNIANKVIIITCVRDRAVRAVLHYNRFTVLVHDEEQ
jgi:hypothetical protein